LEPFNSKYNAIPFVKEAHPNLTECATKEALKGVFITTAIEEKGIREKGGLRNSTLLKQVFALQDNK
jgi:hypothetical protein